MALLESDASRLNHTVSQSGREYNVRLTQRAQGIFGQLLSLLPSNYISGVEGPNYTLELKAVAVELAKLELALEDVYTDNGFATTRSDFLYSTIGYFVFLNGKLPDLEFSDADFRNVLINLIRIYFQGSVPKSMSDVVNLFTSSNLEVTENFLIVRKGTGVLDISDQFGFTVDVVVPLDGSIPDLFAADSTIRRIFDIVRPAHTLYRIRYIFRDKYIPTDGVIGDAMRWAMSNYYYDDFRAYWGGLRDKDRLGRKVNQAVLGERHTF